MEGRVTGLGPLELKYVPPSYPGQSSEDGWLNFAIWLFHKPNHCSSDISPLAQEKPISYDLPVLLPSKGSTPATPWAPQWRKLVELFRKKDSRFYGYDFKVRGIRYRGSVKDTNKKRAERIAALRFSQDIEGTGLLDRNSPSLQEFSIRLLGWVESTALASKTRKYYANGW